VGAIPLAAAPDFLGAAGRAAKLAFQSLVAQDQANVTLFLKSLQVLPEGSDRMVLTE